MKRLHLLAFAGVLALGACSPSPPTDEEISEHIGKATTMSELFLAACSDTGLDLKRVTHVAALSGWKQTESNSRGDQTAAAWQFMFQNKPAVIVVAAGSDDRKGSPTLGRPVHTCGLIAFSSPEKDFARRVSDKLSLKAIDPGDYELREPADSIRMSTSGKEDGSLEMILSLNPNSTVIPRIAVYLGEEKA